MAANFNMDSNICVKKYLANVNNVVQELRYYFDVVILAGNLDWKSVQNSDWILFQHFTNAILEEESEYGIENWDWRRTFLGQELLSSLSNQWCCVTMQVKSTFPWFWQERLKSKVKKVIIGIVVNNVICLRVRRKSGSAWNWPRNEEEYRNSRGFFFGTFGLKVKTKVWNFGQDLKNKLLARIGITERSIRWGLRVGTLFTFAGNESNSWSFGQDFNSCDSSWRFWIQSRWLKPVQFKLVKERHTWKDYKR